MHADQIYERKEHTWYHLFCISSSDNSSLLDTELESSLNRTDKFLFIDFLLFLRQLLSPPSLSLLSISSSLDFLHDIFMKLPARTRSCRRLTIPSLLIPMLKALSLSWFKCIY